MCNLSNLRNLVKVCALVIGGLVEVLHRKNSIYWILQTTESTIV